MTRPPAWHRRAACNGGDPEIIDLFFPRHGGPADPRAKAICATCPSQVPCAEAGDGQAHGIWAGTSPTEREHGTTGGTQ